MCRHASGRKNEKNKYELDGKELNCTDVERDLGVIVASNSKPSEQCLMAAKKANAVLGMIKRNIKTRDKDVILSLYKSLVRPNLEYCVQAWCPYLRKDIEVLEGVQRRATRLIDSCKNRSYIDRLKHTQLQSLENRRVRGDMIEVFKLVKGIDRVDYTKFFTLAKDSIARDWRGHQYKLIKNEFRLDPRKYFFSNRVVADWNKLPQEVVEASTVDCFKAGLDEYNKSRGMY